MPKIEVAILLDKDNNWIEKYILLIDQIPELNKKYQFCFFHDPNKVNQFEIVFILGYTKILGKEFLSSNKLNLVIHESDLPRGKGFSPVQWQILENKNIIPVCMIEATAEVDSGDIVAKSQIELNGDELFNEIREKQANTTIELIKSFLLKYPNFSRIKQTGKATHYRRRNEKDDELDPDKTIREQFNHFRIADNNTFSLYLHINKKKYYLTMSKD